MAEQYKETSDGRYMILESAVEGDIAIRRNVTGRPFQDAAGNHIPLNATIDESNLNDMPVEGEWVVANIVYKFDGKLWGCIQGHNRMHYHPSETPALFEEIYNDFSNGYPEWDQYSSYDIDEIVTLNGVLYKSRIDANTTNPEDYNDTDGPWDYWDKEPFD
jgi:hypothetical protein